MDQVKVNVDERRCAFSFGNHMVVPDFFDDRSWLRHAILLLCHTNTFVALIDLCYAVF